MAEEKIDLCQPLVLKITATEVVTETTSTSITGSNQPDASSVNVAIIIDDIINREPRFLQEQ